MKKHSLIIIIISISVLLSVFLILILRLGRSEITDRPWRIYVDDPDDAETRALLLSYIPHVLAVSPADCDFILSQRFRRGLEGDPAYHQHDLDAHGREAAVYGKPVLIFWITDATAALRPPPCVFLYRTSMYRSVRRPREEILPFVWETVSRISILAPTPRPIVGFCGAVWPNRRRLLDLFRTDPFFDTVYIVRDQFWGGCVDDPQLRREFEDNLLTAHFIPCNRGNGNFSMRFYQALSAGRTPVLVDTDMRFPYEDRIDWDRYIVRGSDEEEVVRLTKQFFRDRDMSMQQRETLAMFHYFFNPPKYFRREIRRCLSSSSPPDQNEVG